MEKSKLPVSRLKPPGFCTPSTSTIQPKIVHKNLQRDYINVHKSVPMQISRRSVSMVDLRSAPLDSRTKIKLGSELNIAKKSSLKTIPDKPVGPKMTKVAPKRPATSKPEQSVAPKVARTAKIPPYDYKARYNLQVEKNATLQASSKEKDSQIATIKIKYDEVTEQCIHLSDELKEKVKQLEEQENYINSLKNDVERIETINRDFSKQITELKEQVSSHITVIHKHEVDLNSLKESIHQQEDVRRAMHNQIQDLKGNIRVFCRVRPQLLSEMNKCPCRLNFIDEDAVEIRKVKESISSVGGKMPEMLEFVFDKVFQPESTQLEVFEELSQLIQSAMDGYNVCVFAYGQTGSGKTHTMQGEQMGEYMGMIPRSVDLIFKFIEKYKHLGWRYTVEASFLEIYNETVRDLLLTNGKENLEIRYNEGKGTTVTNLTVKCVQSDKELHILMQRANLNRAVAVTNYNEHSSRSHAVTKITITGIHSEMGTIQTGSLSLIDLAGSESAKNSDRMVETKSINKSLSALGTVMMALQNKENHVPYRNSKLTYLLQSSLGGNSKTLMFVNIAPLEECYAESVNALRFASKVKEVKITSKKNKSYLKKDNATSQVI